MKKMVLTHSEKLFNNSNEDSRRSLRRMNVEIRTSFESDRGKRQERRDLFDFYLYRWRVSAILKETRRSELSGNLVFLTAVYSHAT